MRFSMITIVTFIGLALASPVEVEKRVAYEPDWTRSQPTIVSHSAESTVEVEITVSRSALEIKAQLYPRE
ncbi:uncharacterized protein N7511_008319 [Penicillium nucicola]|uniref:uncharacterized protein n=1 Tax=Penicillium nucicola TaxID=1850975 RepID=UPI0025457CBE|nr:uncharacterized protein N7511_008319 [Penicillium nucicola]KAJ5754166.1 hypothetical protein N7511_008319 [Penicillium nucicola]